MKSHMPYACFGVDSILVLSIYFIHGHTFPCTTTKEAYAHIRKEYANIRKKYAKPRKSAQSGISVQFQI